MISPEALTIRQLREQVERNDAHTERECAACLKDVAWALLPTLDRTITYVSHEQQCSAGRVDITVIADILEVGGESHPGAYVWELKAPQVPLFHIETKNQACPSPDLSTAENQLLHYHNSVKNSGHLRERWGIVSPDDVRFGGIVIGKDSTMVKCQPNDLVLAQKLAHQALKIRDAVFYRPSGIHVWTWSTVLTILESQTLSHRKFIGDAEARIEFKQIQTESFIAGSPCQMSGQKCPGCKEGILDVSPGEDGVLCKHCGLFIPVPNAQIHRFDLDPDP